jgi:hypothetical protein
MILFLWNKLQSKHQTSLASHSCASVKSSANIGTRMQGKQMILVIEKERKRLGFTHQHCYALVRH